MARLRFFKIPEGAIKRANELEILTDLEFFYKVKLIDISGQFDKPEDFSSWGISERTFYRNVERLKQLGWLSQDDKGKYFTISYDKLFEYLGYDMTLKETERGIRAGNFKIFRIPTNELKHFVEGVALREIELHLIRQEFSIKRSLIQKNNGVKAPLASEKFFLSNRQVAALLGYKSSKKGHEIIKYLEKENRILVERVIKLTGLKGTNVIATMETRLGREFKREFDTL